VGVDGSSSSSPGNLPHLQRDIAESYIAIDGRAEIRIQPTEIRCVLAVTSESETAAECQKAVDATIENLRAAWLKMGVPKENIVADFIAVLPRYEWNLEKRGNLNAGIEKRVGYRMQTNLHLAVPSDEQAKAAIDLAFAQGVTDIIAFDYWSKELDEVKVKAQREALQAAKSKANLLFEGLFENKPPAINLQEQTVVHYPEALYQSFENVDREYATAPSFRDVPFIHAHRPKNTYYRGLYPHSDVQARDLPMRPEISVVSTVRIYYESPAAVKRVKGQGD
jgi:uncharacterized protein YggE